MTERYDTIRVAVDRGVARVTIAHEPLNLLSLELMTELDRYTKAVAADPVVRVVILDSADDDFFIAHGDMAILDDPIGFGQLPIATDQPAGWNPMMRLHEQIRGLPQITIGVLRGLARGGGAELFSALDLRFASLERGGLAQMETPTGILPGAGATAYLPRLIGRARTLEVVLGARLIDAATAQSWGWINRAIPEADLDTYVDALAFDIAALPAGVITAVVGAVDAAHESITHGLDVENDMLGRLFAEPAAARLTRAALAAGAQTRAGERNLEAVLDVLRRSG